MNEKLTIWFVALGACAPGFSSVALAGGDDCASAALVTDGVPAAEGDNSGADPFDDAEAACQPGSDFDVWFEYVATCTGQATVDTFGSGQADTVLSAYAACGGGEIACNDDEGGLLSVVSFATSVGESYWIRLASFGSPGDYDLNISCIGVPGNDICALAQVVTDGAPAAQGNNSQAVLVDDAEASCQANSDFDVWFEYTATLTGTVRADTFGSSQHDTVLSVYDACGGNEVVCSDDTGGLLSQVTFSVTGEQVYYIRLASVAAPGNYEFNVSGCADADFDGVCNDLDACLSTIPGVSVDALGCPPVIPADFNRDGDVDPTDYSAFEACLAGPGISLAGGCTTKDLDRDTDGDLADFATVQRCFNGQNHPADPNCNN